MGGGGVRSKETGQPAGWTRGTKGNGRNERRRQMGGGGVRRGDATTSWTRGLEGFVSQHGRRLLDGEVRREGSLKAMDGATAPRRRGTARNGSSAARDGASTAAMDREHNGDGRRWTARWRIDRDGRRGGNSTARNGAMVT
jgi:hypothetical protein